MEIDDVYDAEDEGGKRSFIQPHFIVFRIAQNYIV